jgi:hypothetical protein
MAWLSAYRTHKQDGLQTFLNTEYAHNILEMCTSHFTLLVTEYFHFLNSEITLFVIKIHMKAMFKV